MAHIGAARLDIYFIAQRFLQALENFVAHRFVDVEPLQDYEYLRYVVSGSRIKANVFYRHLTK